MYWPNNIETLYLYYQIFAEIRSDIEANEIISNSAHLVWDTLFNSTDAQLF